MTLMKKVFLAMGCCAGILVADTALADVNCSANDIFGHVWHRVRVHRDNAQNAVLAACQNNSPRPGTCVAPLRNCFRVAPAVSPAVCVVRDKANRRWRAAGAYPCRYALHKCNHWHNVNGYVNWACWVV